MYDYDENINICGDRVLPRQNISIVKYKCKHMNVYIGTDSNLGDRD